MLLHFYSNLHLSPKYWDDDDKLSNIISVLVSALVGNYDKDDADDKDGAEAVDVLLQVLRLALNYCGDYTTLIDCCKRLHDELYVRGLDALDDIDVRRDIQFLVVYLPRVYSDKL